jgi:hypothetical protein
MAGEKGATFCDDLLKLVFNATAIANLADNAASSPLTNLYLSLHTADPTASGNQTSSEASYTGYARVAVARTSGGFTVSGSSVTLTSLTAFPACTAGALPGQTIAYFGVGTASSGSGKLLYAGPVTPNQNVANGVTPELTTGTTITES